jgi:uncharacterized phage protein (TIGR02218 family)
MRTISPELLAHLRGEQSTLAICWTIEKGNGEIIRSTDHDRDIEITVGPRAGVYRSAANITGSDVRSTSDLSVDNMEVEGAIQDQWEIPDITVAEIEAGLLDNAPVEVFGLNYNSPDDGQISERRGYLGIPSRDSDGRYKVEVRGLTQRLQQTIGWTFSERCNVVEFGDVRCGFNVAAATRTAVVTAVVGRRSFEVQITAGDPAPIPTYFNGAKITFTSGANNSFFREVQRAEIDGSTVAIRTWEEFPADPVVGDTLSLPPACNRLATTCFLVHNNFINFRGYGLFIPGVLRLMAGTTAGSESGNRIIDALEEKGWERQ